MLRRDFQTLRRDQHPQGRVVFVEEASLSTYDTVFGVDPSTGLTSLGVLA